MQTLEDWLGVRLLHRTTRRVALTDVGESFFVQCSRILEDMETARSVARPEAQVRGSMRITAPVVFGSTLHAVSPAYRAGSPKVRSLVSHLATQLGEPE